MMFPIIKRKKNMKQYTVGNPYEPKESDDQFDEWQDALDLAYLLSREKLVGIWQTPYGLKYLVLHGTLFSS